MQKVNGKLFSLGMGFLIALVLILTSCLNNNYTKSEIQYGRSIGKAVLSGETVVLELDSYEYETTTYFYLKYYFSESPEVIREWVDEYNYDRYVMGLPLEEKYISACENQYTRFLNAKENGTHKSYTSEEWTSLFEYCVNNS